MTSVCSTPLLPADGFTPISPHSPAHRFSLALLVLFPAYVVACCAVFFYHRPSSALLRKRHTVHLLVGQLACFTMLGYTAVYDYVGYERFPCVLLLLLFHLGGLSMGTIPLIMKMVLYTNEISTLRVGRLLNQQHQQQQKPQLLQPQLSSLKLPQLSTLSHTSNLTSSSNPFALQPRATWETFSTYARFTVAPAYARPRATLQDRVLNLQFRKSWAYIALWCFLALFIGTVMCIYRLSTDAKLQQNCPGGCRITREDAIANLVLVVWGQLAGPCTVPPRLTDRLGVLQEFRWCFYSSVLTGVGLVLYLVNPAAAVGRINWLNFTLLQAVVNVSLSTVYPVWCARRTLHGLQHLNLEECYAKVQLDRELKSQFRRHLDEELSSEVYWFLDAVDAFQHSTGQAARAKANVLFSEFVQLGSLYEVNLSAATRADATRRMAAAGNETDEMDPAMFQECAREVKNGMLNDGFLRFLHKLDEDKRYALVVVPATPSSALVASTAAGAGFV